MGSKGSRVWMALEKVAFTLLLGEGGLSHLNSKAEKKIDCTLVG